MNAKQVIVLSLVAAATGSVFASEEASTFNDSYGTSASRAQVVSDLSRARATGTAFHDGRATLTVQRPAPSVVSREQVRADLAQAQRDGTAFQDGQASVMASRPTASRVVRAPAGRQG